MAAGDLEKALRTISDQVPQLVDPADQPAKFVRDLHKQWKEDGGKVAGKPRHSDRYLEDQLISQDSRVRSLTPKLVGKTNISPADGGVLVRFMLSNWPRPGPDDEDVQYEPILSAPEIDRVAEYVEDQLKSPPSSSIQASEPAEASASDELPGEPNNELITRLFKESDAIITIAPEQVFVAAGPRTELIGFRYIMDKLREVESGDKKERLLVWVLDFGGPSLEDESTRRKYMNVQALIGRFKALIHYRDAEWAERLSWLKARSSIVILDTYRKGREKVDLVELPNFSTHHASLSTTATEWLSSSQFRALYGSNLEEERMRQRVFQVFFNASREWPSAKEAYQDLRYVGFASFTKSTGETVGRGIELPSLPSRYAEAFRTVCVAAAHILGINIKKPESFPHTGDEAVKQLKYLGYRILNIDEFLAEY